MKLSELIEDYLSPNEPLEDCTVAWWSIKIAFGMILVLFSGYLAAVALGF